MIPQADPGAFVQAHRAEIDEAIGRVLDSGRFILGPEVEAFERDFGAALGGAQVIGVANGTEALWLALKAAGIGPGDEVIVPSLTATATVAAVVEVGARPVFSDVRPSDLTLDPEDVRRRISPNTRAIIPVHLYGNPADIHSLSAVARDAGLAVVEDCAQAHGATYEGKAVGTFGRMAAFSFYPTKNLGALGDGGAVITRDGDVAGRLRLLRQYGWRKRYTSSTHGWNSRLDELQAAVLRVSLKHLPGGNSRRAELADLYDSLLPLSLRGPRPQSPGRGGFHLYTVRHPRRDALQEHLRRSGIGTAIHYPVPVHLQPAYAAFGAGTGSLPVTEGACREILSLPLFPELSDGQVGQAARAVLEFESPG